jgi:hypothetical protein
MSKRQRYNHVRVTLTPTPPPPKTWHTSVYRLDHYVVRRRTRTVAIQLQGEWGNEKRTESISFSLLPGVTDAELVRAAAWFSPHKWIASFGMNVSQFGGKFSQPLDERLLSTLMNPSQAWQSSGYSQPPTPQDEAPAEPPTSSVQWSFHQFPNHSQTPLHQSGNGGNVWDWYKTRTRKMKIGLGCGTIIAVLLFFSSIGLAFGSSNLATPTPTASPSHQTAATGATPTFPQVSEQPTATPTSKPQPTLTPTLKPQPTVTTPPQKPIPCQAVNENPWCFNFVSPGNYIYSPPSAFCNYFPCVNKFSTGRGYVVECQDGMYSQSGGIRSACFSHGRVLQPLYSH